MQRAGIEHGSRQLEAPGPEQELRCGHDDGVGTVLATVLHERLEARKRSLAHDAVTQLARYGPAESGGVFGSWREHLHACAHQPAFEEDLAHRGRSAQENGTFAVERHRG